MIQGKEGTKIFYLNPWPNKTIHDSLRLFFLDANLEKPRTEIPDMTFFRPYSMISLLFL